MAENEQAGPDKPKIITDDDWKVQAQAEKERLSREVEQKQSGKDRPGAPAEAGIGAGADDAGPRPLPAASFSTLVSSLLTQIMFSLGAVEDPESKRRYVNLDLAKHHIDTLGVLEQKTQGNLDDEERKLLDRAMYEARMMYVEIAQRAAGV